jgi:hypothetical protein
MLGMAGFICLLLKTNPVTTQDDDSTLNNAVDFSLWQTMSIIGNPFDIK